MSVFAPRAFVVCALVALASVAARADEIPADQKRSGYDTMGPGTRAMQDNDAENPATLWVLDGEALWSARPGGRKSCADCHGDAASMKGVAARYPRFDAATNAPVDLEQQINICRRERQNAPDLAYESHDLLALTALVARQSRGETIAANADPRAAAGVEAGQA